MLYYRSTFTFLYIEEADKATSKKPESTDENEVYVLVNEDDEEEEILADEDAEVQGDIPAKTSQADVQGDKPGKTSQAEMQRDQSRQRVKHKSDTLKKGKDEL